MKNNNETRRNLPCAEATMMAKSCRQVHKKLTWRVTNVVVQGANLFYNHVGAILQRSCVEGLGWRQELGD